MVIAASARPGGILGQAAVHAIAEAHTADAQLRAEDRPRGGQALEHLQPRSAALPDGDDGQPRGGDLGAQILHLARDAHPGQRSQLLGRCRRQARADHRQLGVRARRGDTRPRLTREAQQADRVGRVVHAPEEEDARAVGRGRRHCEQLVVDAVGRDHDRVGAERGEVPGVGLRHAQDAVGPACRPALGHRCLVRQVVGPQPSRRAGPQRPGDGRQRLAVDVLCAEDPGRCEVRARVIGRQGLLDEDQARRREGVELAHSRSDIVQERARAPAYVLAQALQRRRLRCREHVDGPAAGTQRRDPRRPARVRGDDVRCEPCALERLEQPQRALGAAAGRRLAHDGADGDGLGTWGGRYCHRRADWLCGGAPRARRGYSSVRRGAVRRGPSLRAVDVSGPGATGGPELGQTDSATVMRGSGWGLLLAVVPQLQTLLISVAAARLLGAADFGRQSFIAFISVACVSVFAARVPAALARFGAELLGAHEGGKVLTLLRWTWRAQLLSGAVAAVGFVAAAGFGAEPSSAAGSWRASARGWLRSRRRRARSWWPPSAGATARYRVC